MLIKSNVFIAVFNHTLKWLNVVAKTVVIVFGDIVMVKHKIGYVCVEDLRKWNNKGKKAFKSAVPMFWRQYKNQSNDCYFAA